MLDVGRGALERYGMLVQWLEELPTGEGRGVMSDRGPSPGEDMIDAGESEPVALREADSDLTLEDRTGMLEAGGM